MTKCLITGGAGFIGSHLVDECLLKKWEVIVLDNLRTGKLSNIPSNSNNLQFIKGDITDREILYFIKLKYPDINYIFHLAAVAEVGTSMKNPIYAHETNFDGTLNLLECFKNLKDLKKFVYASSAAVYGDTSNPCIETDIPNPISPYGVDKLSGEYYLKIFNYDFNVPTVSCRFFNVFGERQDSNSEYSGVISIFFDRILKGEDNLIIYGDGLQTRDFIYVKDIVGALIFLAEHEKSRGNIFNIGYGKPRNLLYLVTQIKILLNSDIKLEFKDKRSGDIEKSEANSKKLFDYGYCPKYFFENGLSRLSEYLKNGNNKI